ncbi:unnamed protein product, partial [Rotaria sp. Silwood2]
MSIDLTNDDSTQRSSEAFSSVLRPTVVSPSVARREFRAQGELLIDDLLPSDRTVRNEVDRAAEQGRNILKTKLIAAVEDYRLSISPDIWSDRHRHISYLGASVHFVDENGFFHCFDLFCTEFKWKKKTAANIIKDELAIFGLTELMDKITFITDRETKKKQKNISPAKLLSISTSVRRTELTPTKTETTTITTRTLTQASPELSDEEEELRNAAETDDSSDEETDTDDEEVDYAAATADDIPVSAKAILDVIKNCKSLVKYVKKANLNRQLQLEREKQNNIEQINDDSSPSTTNNSTNAATLHQWRNVLNEVQIRTAPSLYCVLPCITYLREQMINGEKKEKGVQLLDKMFTMEDDYIRASFLHPNYKQLRGATKEQIESCYNFCRDFILPSNTMNDSIRTDENIIQPSAKKLKFMTQLMDKKETAPASADEIDHYIALTVEEEYTDPLVFCRQERNQLTFPT